MKHEVTYQVNAERSVILGRIQAYMECIGYRLEQEGEELVFRRGSIFGSLAGFSPLHWQAAVRARVKQTPNRAMKASFVYQVNTIGQQVTCPEADYWNFEVYGLERAVMAGVDVSAAARAIGLEVEMNNWRTLARLVLAPLVFAPFIIAFVIGIDPLAAFARGIANQVGRMPVIGLAAAVLLISAAAGMYWLPSRWNWNSKTSPAMLLAGTVAQTAYYGVFVLLVLSSLRLLAAVESSTWVVLLIAIGGIGTAFAADLARRG